MKSKIPVLLSVVFSLLACFSVSSISCLDASAETSVYKVESFSGRSFFGDSIPFTYKNNDVLYSGTLEYAGDISGTYRGSNIDANSIMDSQITVNSYDCIMYKASTNAGQFGYLHDVIVDCPVYFSEYARGGFGMTSPSSTSTVTDISNSRIQYPDNYVGEFLGISANTQASSALADYYAVITADQWQGYAWNWRPLLYEVTNGVFFDDIRFDSVLCDYYGQIYFCIWLPYVGGEMTDRPPVTVTTETTNTMPSQTIDVNVSVNVQVDNSEVVSQLDEYLGGDDTGITTFTQVSFSDVSIDYDILTTEFQIADVIQRTSNGIGAIWGLVSDLIFNIPFLAWLIPFAVLMAILSFVLWRKG